jgi:uncharacterized protein involved in exopolysaccharide biosynthesis/CO dehydrogenase nickel-insertion accessory protein CooC1
MDSDIEPEDKSPGISMGDIYFVLFRHKWLIVLSSAGGLLAAVLLLYVVKPPRYQSQAKLLIKYINEIKSPLANGTEETALSLESPATLINTEIATLKSLDLGQEVVSTLGTERILGVPDNGTNRDLAAAMVIKGMEIDLIGGGGVVGITYSHKDPAVVQDTLSKIILAYYKKHYELHTPVGIADFLSKETQRLQAELAQTEKELQAVKRKSGVISPEAVQKSYAEEISKIRESLFEAQAQLATQQVFESVITNTASTGSNNTNAPALPPRERISEYKRLCARLDFFSKREQELLTQFKETSTLVLEIRDRIAETEKLKAAMEEQYPSLANVIFSLPRTPGTSGDVSPDPTTQIRSLKSKIEVLTSQMNQLQDEAAKIDEAANVISELQRKKELQETDLKRYLSSLDQIRMTEAMGTASAQNISVIESPTPPVKNWSKQFKKKVGMVAAAGIFGGLAFAFIMELLLDRSVKRPGDIENKLRLPLLMSIPDTNRKGRRKKLALPGNSEISLLPATVATENNGWNQPNSLSRFYTGLRDRVLVYFEVRNVTHKPKLVAVTSCHKGAGVTSIAAGLAASLSETGDGNVLLVDMNPEQQVLQQFHKGKLAMDMAGALEPGTKQNAMVQEKLYMVTERTENEKQYRVLPKRFSEMVPKLKTSDYDYIIFDMPPVSPTSVTPRLAGLMDMVLLVIESEKTNQDVVKKVTALLGESKATVTTVLNKTHNYVPTRLHQEYLHEP